MADADPLKDVLLEHLREGRDDLIGKVENLDAREARVPRTPTGNNLLGLVKDCLNVEAGYLGATFGRPFPSPDELVPLDAYELDPQADWYATLHGLVDLYRRVGAFVDQNVADLPLDAPGTVAWWQPDGRP